MFQLKTQISLWQYVSAITRRYSCLLLVIFMTSCGRSENGSSGNSLTQPTTVSTAQVTNVTANADNATKVAMDNGEGYPLPANGPTAQMVIVLSAAPRLGVVVDKDMKVLFVEPYGAAKKGGIQIGDIIDSVEDVKVSLDVNKAKNLIGNAQKDKKIKIKLKRGGKNLQVEVVPDPSQPSGQPTSAPGQLLPTPTPVVSPNNYL